jgi:hypothetical protein
LALMLGIGAIEFTSSFELELNPILALAAGSQYVSPGA